MTISGNFPKGRTTMITRLKIVIAIAASAFAVTLALPAQALTMQECSAKYKAAQTAGTLGGQKWNDFRKEQCQGNPPPPPAATPAAPKTAEAKPAKPKTETAS